MKFTIHAGHLCLFTIIIRWLLIYVCINKRKIDSGSDVPFFQPVKREAFSTVKTRFIVDRTTELYNTSHWVATFFLLPLSRSDFISEDYTRTSISFANYQFREGWLTGNQVTGNRTCFIGQRTEILTLLEHHLLLKRLAALPAASETIFNTRASIFNNEIKLILSRVSFRYQCPRKYRLPRYS